MKLKAVILITAFVLGAVVPGVVASLSIPDKAESIPQPEPTSTASTETETTSADNAGLFVPILMPDGIIVTMPLDEYITGVVLQEMPASFETEALKSQAVVARTYTLKQLESGKKHPGCAVCTDSDCCQGYCAVDDYISVGGLQSNVDKVKQAVRETGDLVLTYENKLIEATYFSCSGGRTENAVAVWGTEVPYLQSVESPGEQESVHYVDTVTFSASEVESLLERNLDGDAGTWFRNVTYTDGGGVDTIEIGGEIYSGITLRRLLGLKSTAFVITAIGDTVTVTTKGFGHRVGMSQYGADAMALAGSTYEDILSHYYPGTLLQTYSN